MRHFLWLKADGLIGGFHVITGGWSVGFDPTDLTESNLQAKFIRDSHENAGDGFASYFEYNCPCDTSVGLCDCVNTAVEQCHVEAGALTLKPTLAILLDSQNAAGTTADTPLVLPAGTDVTCQLTTDSIPDGTVAQLVRVGGPDNFATYPVDLTFTGNATNTVTFSVPAKGMISAFRVDAAKYVRGQIIFVKGW
jgi:hypothetical protein